MSTLPFAGRRDALRFLWDRLHLSFQHDAGLVLLSAPAGAGKTALIRHFLETVADPFVCATGRGWDNRAAVSYHVLREALLQLPGAQEYPDSSIRAFLRNSVDPEGEALRPEVFFPALARFLSHCAQDRPLCLFLDDLQWADEGTIAWLDYALRQMEGISVLWIGAYRSEEASSLGSLLDRLQEWHQTERFCEYVLEPLTRAEVEELTWQSIPKNQWQEDLPDRVWKRSEGLALLAVEEIRAYREGQPETPRGPALIAARLNRLSAEDRELLAVAAVVGERFDLEPLGTTLELDLLDVARRLEKLRREQGLLEEDGGGYRFVHSRFRESLLDSMSQAMRQTYHARLARQDIELLPVQRTYHLVHSGDSQQGVQALLAEGDQTRILMDWKDALRYYIEALWLVQREASQESRLYLDIYLRLGDVQLLAARQPVVARSYYEAARVWARTSREQVLLLCRLAETCRGYSPEGRRYLEEATQHLLRLDDPQLVSWVEFRRLAFTAGLSTDQWRRVGQLCRQVGTIPDLPQELLAYAEDWALQATRMTHDHQGIEAFRIQLDSLPPDTWLAAKCHAELATADRKDNPGQVLHHAREARRIFSLLGRTAEMLNAYNQEFSILMETGQYREVRAIFQELFEDIEPGNILEILYGALCRSWIHDRPAAGMEWATRYLRGLESFFVQFPTDSGHLRKLLASLGTIERIFRAAHQEGEFRRQIEALRERLRQAGYRTEGVWFPEGPVALDEIETPFTEEEWTWKPGSSQARMTREGEVLLFHNVWSEHLSTVDTPRLELRLQGAFSLQMTVRGGEAILESARQCQRQVETGQSIQRVASGGGILVLPNRQSWLRLSAHQEAPSQVLFQECKEGWTQTLGRGLFEDPPIRLRLERRGKCFYAYAGNEGGEWYGCGQVDLPEWNQVEVGVYGEASMPLDPGATESVETRCWNIGLESKSPRPDFRETQDGLYSLPVPTIDPDLPEVVAASRSMQRILEQARQSGDSSLPVLIQGETGTGKELVARAIHRLSSRSSGPFMPLNCGAITPSLLESELFGHVRGAYTGANEAHGGIFEAANQGFLFLDEIGEASLPFQIHLLRVIEEQLVRRVGDQELRPIDVRIVAATNQDLQQAIQQQCFRQDLYFRLKGMELHLPPLRERRDDIPHLVAHALISWSQQKSIPCPKITRKAMETLLAYDWPGNVRELLHAVERAAEETAGKDIASIHLAIQSPHLAISPFPSAQEEYERIAAALRETSGNISAAARRLGFHRNTLYRKIKKLGIPAR